MLRTGMLRGNLGERMSAVAECLLMMERGIIVSSPSASMRGASRRRVKLTGAALVLNTALPVWWITEHYGFLRWVEEVTPTTTEVHALVRALREVGGDRIAELLEEALAVLPGSRMPKLGWIDSEWLEALAPERARAFREIDRALRRERHNVCRALLAYTERHIDQLISAGA